MTANPPNPELAALPNLFLLHPQSWALVHSGTPYGGSRVTRKHYSLLIILLLIPGIVVLWSNNPVAIIMYGAIVPIVLLGIGGDLRRRQLLAQKGRILRARILQYSAQEGGEGFVQIRVRYEFVTPMGKTITSVENRGIYYKYFEPLTAPIEEVTAAVLYVHDGCYQFL